MKRIYTGTILAALAVALFAVGAIGAKVEAAPSAHLTFEYESNNLQVFCENATGHRLYLLGRWVETEGYGFAARRTRGGVTARSGRGIVTTGSGHYVYDQITVVKDGCL